MNNPALPYAKTTGSRFGASSLAPRERRTKKFFRFKLRNLLKTLDSDEEIQDNPTLMACAFASEMAGSQENPNRPDERRVRCRDGAEPKAQAKRAQFRPTPERSKSQQREPRAAVDHAPTWRLSFVSMRWRLKSLMEANWNVPSLVSASIEPSEKIL